MLLCPLCGFSSVEIFAYSIQANPFSLVPMNNTLKRAWKVLSWNVRGINSDTNGTPLETKLLKVAAVSFTRNEEIIRRFTISKENLPCLRRDARFLERSPF
jgi:hypothetical protein